MRRAGYHYGRHPLRAACAGFTLIELMVAIAVGGMVSMLAHATIVQVATRHEHAYTTVDRERQAVAVRRLLRTWLENVTVAEPGSGAGGLAGFERHGRSGSGDEVRFVTSAARPVFEGAAYVRVWVARGDDGGARLTAAVRPVHGGPAAEIVLDSTATGLAVSYRASAVSPWRDGWQEVNTLPRAVRISIERGVEPVAVTASLPLLVLLGTE